MPNDARMIYPEMMNTNGLPFVYSALPNNGPTTFPIDNIVCLAPISLPLSFPDECFDSSFCSKGVIVDLQIQYQIYQFSILIFFVIFRLIPCFS